MTRLIQVLTLGLPWVIFPWAAEPWTGPKELCWLAGCWALLLFGTFTQSLPTIRWGNRWMAWLGLCILGSGLLHFYLPIVARPRHLETITYNLYQWIPVIYLLTALLTIRLLAVWCLQPDHLARMTRWLCAGAVAVAVYACLQGLGLDQWYRASYTLASPDHPMGVAFGNAGTTAMFLAPLLPLFFLFQGFRWLLAGSLVLAVILYLPFRSSWLVAGVGLGSYGLLRLWAHWPQRGFRSLLLGGLFLSLACGIAGGLRVLQQDERWVVWSETLYQWQTSPTPWTGRGLQSFPAQFTFNPQTLRPIHRQQLTDSRWETAFNEWLQGLYELGLLGMGLLGLALGSTVTRWMRRARSAIDDGYFAAALAMLTCTAVFFPFHHPAFAWNAMVLWAVGERPYEGV